MNTVKYGFHVFKVVKIDIISTMRRSVLTLTGFVLEIESSIWQRHKIALFP